MRKIKANFVIFVFALLLFYASCQKTETKQEKNEQQQLESTNQPGIKKEKEGLKTTTEMPIEEESKQKMNDEMKKKLEEKLKNQKQQNVTQEEEINDDKNVRSKGENEKPENNKDMRKEFQNSTKEDCDQMWQQIMEAKEWSSSMTMKPTARGNVDSTEKDNRKKMVTEKASEEEGKEMTNDKGKEMPNEDEKETSNKERNVDLKTTEDGSEHTEMMTTTPRSRVHDREKRQIGRNKPIDSEIVQTTSMRGLFSQLKKDMENVISMESGLMKTTPMNRPIGNQFVKTTPMIGLIGNKLMTTMPMNRLIDRVTKDMEKKVSIDPQLMKTTPMYRLIDNKLMESWQAMCNQTNQKGDGNSGDGSEKPKENIPWILIGGGDFYKEMEYAIEALLDEKLSIHVRDVKIKEIKSGTSLKCSGQNENLKMNQKIKRGECHLIVAAMKDDICMIETFTVMVSGKDVVNVTFFQQKLPSTKAPNVNVSFEPPTDFSKKKDGIEPFDLSCPPPLEPFESCASKYSDNPHLTEVKKKICKEPMWQLKCKGKGGFSISKDEYWGCSQLNNRRMKCNTKMTFHPDRDQKEATTLTLCPACKGVWSYYSTTECRNVTYQPNVTVITDKCLDVPYENEKAIPFKELLEKFRIRFKVTSIKVSFEKNVTIHAASSMKASFQMVYKDKPMMIDIKAYLKMLITNINNKLELYVYGEDAGENVNYKICALFKVKACDGYSTRKNKCGMCAPEKDCCVGFKDGGDKDDCGACHGELENGTKQVSKCFYNDSAYVLCDHDLCQNSKNGSRCWKDCNGDPCGSHIVFCEKCVDPTKFSSEQNIACVKQVESSSGIVGICAKSLDGFKLKSGRETCGLTMVTEKYISENTCFTDPQIFTEVPEKVKCMNFVIESGCTPGENYKVVDANDEMSSSTVIVKAGGKKAVFRKKYPENLKMNANNMITLQFDELELTKSYRICYLVTQKKKCIGAIIQQKGSSYHLMIIMFVRRFSESFSITVENCLNEKVSTVVYSAPKCTAVVESVSVGKDNMVSIKYNSDEILMNKKLKKDFKQAEGNLIKASAIQTDEKKRVCISKNLAYCRGGSASEDKTCDYYQPKFIDGAGDIMMKGACGVYQFEHLHKCSTIKWTVKNMEEKEIYTESKNDLQLLLPPKNNREMDLTKGFTVMKQCTTITKFVLTFSLQIDGTKSTALLAIKKRQDGRGEYTLTAISCKKDKNQKLSFEVDDDGEQKVIRGTEIKIGDNYRSSVEKIIKVTAVMESDSGDPIKSKELRLSLKKLDYELVIKGKSEICTNCDMKKYKMEFEVKSSTILEAKYTISCRPVCPEYEIKKSKRGYLLEVESQDLCGKSVQIDLEASFPSNNLRPISKTLTLTVGLCAPVAILTKKRSTDENYELVVSLVNAKKYVMDLIVKDDITESNTFQKEDINVASKKKGEAEILILKVPKNKMVYDVVYIIQLDAQQDEDSSAVFNYEVKKPSPLVCTMVLDEEEIVTFSFQCEGSLNIIIEKSCMLIKKSSKIRCGETTDNSFVCKSIKKTYVAGYIARCKFSNDEMSTMMDLDIPTAQSDINDVNDLVNEITDDIEIGDSTGGAAKLMAALTLATQALSNDKTTLASLQTFLQTKVLEITNDENTMTPKEKASLASAAVAKTSPDEPTTDTQIKIILKIFGTKPSDDQVKRRKRRAIENDNIELPVSFEEASDFLTSMSYSLYPVSDDLTLIQNFEAVVPKYMRSLCVDSDKYFTSENSQIEAVCIEMVSGFSNNISVRYGNISVHLEEQTIADYSTWECTESTGYYCSGFMLAVLYLSDYVSDTDTLAEPYTGVSGTSGHVLKSGVYHAAVVNPEYPHEIIDVNFRPVRMLITLSGMYDDGSRVKCHARLNNMWDYSQCTTSNVTQQSVVCTCPNNLPVAVFQLEDYIEIINPTTQSPTTTENAVTSTAMSEYSVASTDSISSKSTEAANTDTSPTEDPMTMSSTNGMETMYTDISSETMETATPVTDVAKIMKVFEFSLLGDMMTFVNSFGSIDSASANVLSQVKMKLQIPSHHLYTYRFSNEGVVNFTIYASQSDINDYIKDIKEKVFGQLFKVTDNTQAEYDVDKVSLIIDGVAVKSNAEEEEDDSNKEILISVLTGVAIFITIAILASMFFVKKKKNRKIGPKGKKAGSGMQLTKTKKNSNEFSA